MSCEPFTGLVQFCRPPAARRKAWRGVARQELREEGRGEGREERVRLLQLERVELPTPSSSVPSLGCARVASGGLGCARMASGGLERPRISSETPTFDVLERLEELENPKGKAERGEG